MAAKMLYVLFLAAVPVATAARARSEAGTNPLAQVLKLIDELQAKIESDGEVQQKAFKEYFEWCDDTAKNTANEIKTGEASVEKLTAKISELASSIEVADTNIGKLAGEIATRTAELKKATGIREKEATDFSASEKELMGAVDALERAVGILEKQAKGGAALVQVDTGNMANLISAVSVMLDAAAFPAADQKKLSSFLQAQQGASEDSEEDDDMSGAPAAAAYKNKSGGIIEVLEDMKEKAESQLDDLRKAETTNRHNFDMLKQSLDDEIAADNKDMEQEKEDKSAAAEQKAGAEGELEVTAKELAANKKELETAQSTCMTVASDHEASVRSMQEELKVIAEAEKILKETTGEAEKGTYSFVQTSVSRRSTSKVGHMIDQLAKKQHSSALAQLSSRVDALYKYGQANGESPFGKVKTLIVDMIAKLEKEAGEEAEEKAYCDAEMKKTVPKKEDLEDDVEKMTAKIDQAVAKSAELQKEVKDLQKELSLLAKEQAEMDKIRGEQHDEYLVAKKDLEMGLNGVRKALGVLNDYYASKEEDSAALLQDGGDSMAFMQQPAMPVKHKQSGGAGSSIIGILEVCESDFATGLAKTETEEADAQDEYEKVTQENEVSRTSKMQDVKYKTGEYKGLEKTVAEISEDRTTSQSELSAVMEYYAKLQDRCVAKPESYEERKARREAEISGLKEALQILEDESSFVQEPRKRRGNMRGAIEAN